MLGQESILKGHLRKLKLPQNNIRCHSSELMVQQQLTERQKTAEVGRFWTFTKDQIKKKKGLVYTSKKTLKKT